MFISDKFMLNNIHCDDKGVRLISMESDILNKYGLDYASNIISNKKTKDGTHNYYDDTDSVEDVTLQFTLTDEFCNPITWDRDTLIDIIDWFTCDNFVPFVSEDDEEITYFFRTKSITKMFNANMHGYIEVVFQPYSNYVYKSYTKKIHVENSITINITNESNVDEYYNPIIEFENLGDQLNIIGIKNESLNDEEFIIYDLEPDDKVVIDTLMGTVFNTYGDNLLVKCNRKWTKLKKGRNILSISGNANITIKCLFPLKV